MSNGILLSQHNEVIALDIIPEKEDVEYLKRDDLNFKATLDKNDPQTNYFNS